MKAADAATLWVIHDFALSNKAERGICRQRLRSEIRRTASSYAKRSSGTCKRYAKKAACLRRSRQLQVPYLYFEQFRRLRKGSSAIITRVVRFLRSTFHGSSGARANIPRDIQG